MQAFLRAHLPPAAAPAAEQDQPADIFIQCKGNPDADQAPSGLNAQHIAHPNRDQPCTGKIDHHRGLDVAHAAHTAANGVIHAATDLNEKVDQHDAGGEHQDTLILRKQPQQQTAEQNAHQ